MGRKHLRNHGEPEGGTKARVFSAWMAGLRRLARAARNVSLLGLALWFAPTMVCAASSLEHARRGQAMLGPERWSQVIRIENTARSSDYPREVFGLVFELGGLLWFYTASEGTQSLSLHENDLVAEKADLAPLLQAIDPGFTRYEVMPATAMRDERAKRRRLPNGCLIESYAELRRRVLNGERITDGRLLTLYYNGEGRRAGHTVLSYQTPEGTFVFDPLTPAIRRRLRVGLSASAMEVGRKLPVPFSVIEARWVPTTMPQVPQLAGTAPAWPARHRTNCEG